MDDILAGLDSVEEARRDQAIQTLAASTDGRAYLLLEDHLTREPNPRLKFQAETALRQLGGRIRATIPPCTLVERNGARQIDNKALSALVLGKLPGATDDDRLRGLNVLCTFRNESLGPLLQQALSEPHPPALRLLLVQTLGANASASQVPILGTLLGDRNPQVRQMVVEALLYCREASAYPYFVRALADPDPGVKKRAYRPLARLGASVLQRFMAGLLQNGQDWERMAVARALPLFRGTPFRQLIGLATKDAHPTIRAQAMASLQALAKGGDEAARAILVQLQQENVATNAAAGAVAPPRMPRGARERGEEHDAPSEDTPEAPPPPDAPPPAPEEGITLVAVRHDDRRRSFELEADEPEKRMKAIEALADASDEEALHTLASRLDEEKDKKVIAFLVTVLGRSGEGWLAPKLRSFLSHEDPRVRASAVEALGQTLPDEEKGCLKHLLEDSHNRIRSCAILALGPVDGFDVVPALTHMLESPDLSMLKSGIYTLVALEREELVRYLVGLAKHENEDIAQMARDGMANLADGGSKAAQRGLKRLESSPTAPKEGIAKPAEKEVDFRGIAPTTARRKPVPRPGPKKANAKSKGSESSTTVRPWVLYLPILVNMLLALVSILGGLETQMDSAINLPLGIAFCLFFLVLAVVLWKGFPWARWLQILVAAGGAALFVSIDLPLAFPLVMLVVLGIMFVAPVRAFCNR